MRRIEIRYPDDNFSGFMQDCGISGVLAMEMPWSFRKPLIYDWFVLICINVTTEFVKYFINMGRVYYYSRHKFSPNHIMALVTV